MSGRNLIRGGLLLLVCVLPGCSSSGSSTTDSLKIGAYSVVKEVIHDGLLPAFAAAWQKKTGRVVQFEESYNGSGAQTRLIQSGFDADIAILSHAGDMESLVKAKRVKPTWNAGSTKGMITNSLVVLGHRAGNPKQIQGWSDLAKSGIGVLYPDPKTSGGARWNINAIYGASYLESKRTHGGQADLEEVGDFMAKVQANVVNMDPSGRQSMANFTTRNTGDVVVTYENELLLHNKESDPIPYVIPASTLLIEGPAALVDESLEAHGNRAVAEAFLEFLVSEQGQAIFAQFGFRPVKPGGPAPSGAQPMPTGLFTMADLGGWAKIEPELYGPEGLWTRIFTGKAGAKVTGR
jgi:sulfate transport system substrate-binding protein